LTVVVAGTIAAASKNCLSHRILRREEQDLKAYAPTNTTELGMAIDTIPDPSKACTPIVSSALSASKDTDEREEQESKAADSRGGGVRHQR
jgi:hypothetical protein